MTLTYELPKAEFDRFLLNSFGIETNELSVRDAVRTLIRQRNCLIAEVGR